MKLPPDDDFPELQPPDEQPDIDFDRPGDAEQPGIDFAADLPPLSPAPEPDEPQPDPVQKPLEEAEDLVYRARLVSTALFKEARNMPEYRRMLATSRRNAQFESKLLAKGKEVDARLGTNLSDSALNEVVDRLANRVAAWEHSPDRQRERQRKQAAARRRKNRGRDLQIVRYTESGESQRRVADRFGISRGAIQNVLRRDAPHLLDRRELPRLPDRPPVDYLP